MTKRFIPKITIPSMALILSVSYPSFALDSSNVDIAGFASIGYAKTIDADKKISNSATNLYTGAPIESASLYNITDEGDYRGLTKMGIRMDIDMDDKLSFAAQMLAKGQDDYNPTFDWLYASYKFTPGLSLTVGRFVGPVFMYSDSYEVAYASHWVQLPFGAYNDNSLPIEGAKLTWETSISSNFSSRTTIFAGNGEGEIKELNGTLVLDENLGISWEVGISDWLNLRAIHFTAKASLPELDYLINDPRPGLAAADKKGINDQLASAVQYDVDELDWKNERINFSGIGVAIDTEYVFFNTEYTHTKVDESNLALHESVSWYAMIGARVTPTLAIGLTFTSQENEANQEIADNYTAKVEGFGIPAGSPTHTLLTTASQKLVDTGNQEKEVWTLGVRWDFNPKAALKFEYIAAQKYIDLATDNRKPDAFRVGLNLIF